MTKVFIGGSRRLSRLNADVRRRLDRIIAQRFPVLVGDANGADRAVQQYLLSRNYDNVQVFCSGGRCRNNLGDWPVQIVRTSHSPGTFEFYAAKDQRMAEEASIGLLIWDGKSSGTLTNAARLLELQKDAVVYATPEKEFFNLRTPADLTHLTSRFQNVRIRNASSSSSRETKDPGSRQQTLL